MSLRTEDLVVFARHVDAKAHAFSKGLVSAEDKERYWRVFKGLGEIAENVLKALKLDDFFLYSSRFSRDGGIQGQRPKDLWWSLCHNDSVAFGNNPQIFIIANHKGIEIGFSVSINEANYYNTEIKYKNRDIIPRIIKKLPVHGSSILTALESNLQSSLGWRYLPGKTRKWPDETSYTELKSAGQVFEYLRNDPESFKGGGLITRYVPKDAVESSNFDLQVMFLETAEFFAPLCRECTPTARDKVAVETSTQIEIAEGEIPDFVPPDEKDGRDRTLRQIAVRRGQGKFRLQLLEAYEGRCAITGSPVI